MLGGNPFAWRPVMSEHPNSPTPEGIPDTAFAFNADSSRAVTPPLPDANLSVPAEVGRYRIEGVIGQGGMGLVLRAADNDFGRVLAVKVLLEQHRSEPSLEHRFLEEARLTGQLQHPG